MSTAVMNMHDHLSTHKDNTTDAHVDPESELIEAKMRDAEGRVIVHKYLKGKLLGKGGFAKCYHGVSLPSKTGYALKIVLKTSLVKSRAKQKLQSEIKIHRGLRHNNICRFERFFEDKLHAYMVLELCVNNSMSELIKRRKKLTEPEVRLYVIQLISALKYLHSNCVIHRDLKLGNLFLDSNMQIKVGDFGLATKLTSRDERKRTMCGTPNYIAPEILDGKDGHSFEVDVWSTGVIIYTLLVGKPPYESKDVKSTYKMILANSYTYPDHVTVGNEAKSLIRTILQLAPEKRPSLESIGGHNFFNAYTPHAIPSLALRDTPTLAQLQACQPLKASSHVYGNENDASAANSVFTNLEKNSAADNYNDRHNAVVKPYKIEAAPIIQPAARRPMEALNSHASVKPLAPVSSSMHAKITQNKPIEKLQKFDIFVDTEPALSHQLAKSKHVEEKSGSILSVMANTKDSRPSIEVRKISQRLLPLSDFDDCNDGDEDIDELHLQLDEMKFEEKGARRPLDAWGSKATTAPSNFNLKTPVDVIKVVDKGTLETMHETLSQSFAGRQIDKVAPVHQLVMNMENLIAKVWVVKYVDYTSKYGLGFLLNTGSAGVYFNDSTKIVLSPDGNGFLYVERRRKAAAGSSEHVSQNFAMASYPAELQKKVTLLRHFRNYLMDQNKENGEIPDSIESCTLQPSSVVTHGTKKDSSDACSDIALPFLKKWVRTRHAILFRLSNRTVQVVFFDKSEVLLSSEAKIVTYVNKSGERSEHTLNDVLSTERADIAKRLKYTKDILYRLINLQTVK